MRAHLVRGGCFSFMLLYVLSSSLWGTNSQLTSNIFPQMGYEKEKILEKGHSLPNSPVMIYDLNAGGRSLKFDQSFESGDDWLKGAGFKLKNVSNKEIVFVQVDFNFPETRSTGSEMSFPIIFGNHPGRRITSNAPLSLAPGEELDILIDEEIYPRLSGFVEQRLRMSDVKKAVVHIGFVVFADGLGYGAGYYYRQDPNKPTRWIPIKDEQGNPRAPG